MQATKDVKCKISFTPHFYSLLMNTYIQVQINHLEAFQMLENMARHSEIQALDSDMKN